MFVAARGIDFGAPDMLGAASHDGIDRGALHCSRRLTDGAPVVSDASWLRQEQKLIGHDSAGYAGGSMVRRYAVGIRVGAEADRWRQAETPTLMELWQRCRAGCGRYGAIGGLPRIRWLHLRSWIVVRIESLARRIWQLW